MAYVEDGNKNVQFICSNDKKNVFLIGDSIRRGYCHEVRRQLADSAEVFFIDENCRNTQYVITGLYSWANMFSDPGMVDVVLFNCGHWDTAHFYGSKYPLTSESEYDKNIRVIIDMIKKLFVNASVVFATTTAMNPNGIVGINPRTTKTIAKYNELAQNASEENGVGIIDLFGITNKWDKSFYADYCHFTPESNELLGKAVADALKSYL